VEDGDEDEGTENNVAFGDLGALLEADEDGILGELGGAG
jgi:hypothetical protein